MAYRRRRPTPRASTFEDFSSSFNSRGVDSPASTTTTLSTQAIRSPGAHRESSLLSANVDPLRQTSVFFNQNPFHHEYSSLRCTNEKGANESNYGFWGVLAKKVKSLLEDDSASQQFNGHSRNEFQMLSTSTDSQFNQPNLSPQNFQKAENLASSLNQIGGTIKSAFEEGLAVVENRAADIIQETKKIQIRRKTAGFNSRGQVADLAATANLFQNLSDQDNPLKASRNQADALAAKAKLLLRELKTAKADLAFAKQRCDQLVEENKLLRENREKGDNTEDDDLIRLQLETLLAEKGRLAHENSIYARENRFLREIVEYHNHTMQDVVHLDDGISHIADDRTTQISSLFSSSGSASEVISPALSSPRTPPDSMNLLNNNDEPDFSSPAAAAPRENVNEECSKSPPKSVAQGVSFFHPSMS
ncbi:uncharacterized protein LOC110024908 [Phalaenopsis equestris]|uniref:uncharacterized protein LOC110024908 n=1 Tax=Phalaenopsis equestris TaxID=78828 RepID=UPI0009E1D079|nr:uncharacterized protein LOC110024908 [Phalaenopsis equestris]